MGKTRDKLSQVFYHTFKYDNSEMCQLHSFLLLKMEGEIYQKEFFQKIGRKMDV